MSMENGASSPAPRFSHIAKTDESLSSSYLSSSPDLLEVILDLDPLSWAAALDDEAKTLDEKLRQVIVDLCIFLNAHAALRHENAVAIYAASNERAELLFSNAPLGRGKATKASRLVSQSGESKPDANTYQPFKIVSDAVLDGVADFLKEAGKTLRSNGDAGDGLGGERRQTGSTGVVSALSQALCHIHRLSLNSAAHTDPTAGMGSVSIHGGSSMARKGGGSRGSYKSRVLVLSVSPDSSRQYVPVMNCIFGAQKRGVLIDVCKLCGNDSVFLQQASHLTGGTYFRLKSMSSLLQTLMTAFLASPTIRTQIRLPSNDDVDFRAACFCHGKIVDVGYVCSVCLSIFCTPRDRCITCRAAFPERSLARYDAEKRTLISGEQA